MMAKDRRRFAAWVVVAMAVCGAWALRELVSYLVERRFDPALAPSTAGQWTFWWMAFYLTWAALTPLIWWLGRRLPFRRNHWIGPLVFHLAASISVSAAAPVAVGYAMGAGLRGFDTSTLPSLFTPYWMRFALYNAIANTSLYWLILGAGFGLGAYDEARARQRRAADLERALVAAQVDALKLKLQPHFLFNTLNSISFLAVEEDANGVVTVVQRLRRLLRSSMQSVGSQLITVEEELALLEEYLSIEEVRFADRLRIVRRIAPDAMSALIPSLVLQPVIENSIKHGFSRRLDARRLELSVDRDGNWLVITVEDDGPGVPAGWDMATHCGRGLRNVIERIEKIYAGEWYFTLRNGPRGGAVARLQVPWQAAPLEDSAEQRPLL